MDRAGLALAKDIRARVGRLTAEVDALGARLQDAEDQLAELAEGRPGPGTQLVRHGRGRAGGRAGQAVRVGDPRPGPVPAGRPSALRPCWRAHWPAIWELGVLWAEWRRVYGRKAPELAGALELAGRWVPGALERVRRELAECTDRQCILNAMTSRWPT